MPEESEGRGAIWSFGPFRLSSQASELTRDGAPVPIEPQSLRLLEYLIRHRDRVVTRDDLVAALWEGRAVSDWVVASAVKSLRASLGDSGRPKRFVGTIHSRGFRFVADVTAETGLSPGDRPTASRTILVRPIRSRADSATELYLADGLTEDLITDLSGHSAFAVLSYNASRSLGNRDPPSELGVTHIVDGRLRRADDTLRINVAVLGADGRHQIWAERFDITMASLLAAQDRISARVAEALAPGTLPTGVPTTRSRSPEAYDHYLKGRYAYFLYTPRAFAEALGHFRAAAECDPDFADAYAQQAYCRTTLLVFGLPGADRTLDPAEALARKAIAIDDGSALAHARLGWVLGYRGKPEAAVAAFERAVARNPDDAEVWLAYGETMNRLARPDRALPLLESAFSRESYHPPSWEFTLGHMRVLLREQERAIGHLTAVIERVGSFIPARVQLARAYWETGEARAASDTVADIRSLVPAYGLAHAERMFPYPVPSERSRLLDALSAAGMR